MAPWIGIGAWPEGTHPIVIETAAQEKYVSRREISATRNNRLPDQVVTPSDHSATGECFDIGLDDANRGSLSLLFAILSRSCANNLESNHRLLIRSFDEAKVTASRPAWRA
jgi:hypothetical protein